jgi:hypothetical protein
MNVPTIEMNQEEAKQKVEEYQKAVRENKYPPTLEGKRQRELDLAAVIGFKALADGKRVINVHTALSHAGLRTDGSQEGLPRLAIARADSVAVTYRKEGGDVDPRYSFAAEFEGGFYKKNNVRLEFRDLVWNATLTAKRFVGRWSYRAITPTIPPAVRPRYAHLSKMFILWEADWERSPVDPFLLRHLAGDLYSIEAQWDLTDLERGLLEHAMLRR